MTSKLKALGLAFVAVFAMSALAAQAAQAAPAHFTANSPTGNVFYTAEQDESNPHQVLTTEFGYLDCAVVQGTSTTASNTETTIKSTVEYFGTTSEPSGPCEAFGLEAELDMNGCEYVFHAGEYEAEDKSTGTVDLSCPETNGPTIAILGGLACTLTFHSVEGLGPVHYETVQTEGKPEEVTINSTIATGIPYTAEGPFCPGEGVTEGGSYEGKATVSAFEDKDVKGEEVGATITETGETGQGHFTSSNTETASTIFTAEQDESNPHQVFTTEFGYVDCDMFHGQGTAAATSTDVTLEDPEYFGTTEETGGECEAFGLSAEIDMNGCDYHFYAGEYKGEGESTGTADLSCEGTDGPVISILGGLACTITVHAVEGLESITYKSEGGSVTVEANVQTGIPYTAEGPFCPGEGVTTDGTYEGNATVSAFEDEGGEKGNQVNASITST